MDTRVQVFLKAPSLYTDRLLLCKLSCKPTYGMVGFMACRWAQEIMVPLFNEAVPNGFINVNEQFSNAL